MSRALLWWNRKINSWYRPQRAIVCKVNITHYHEFSHINCDNVYLFWDSVYNGMVSGKERAARCLIVLQAGSIPRSSLGLQNVQQRTPLLSFSWRKLWGLADSVTLFLHVTTLKYSASQQTDGQTSKDIVLKGSMSLTMALKKQIASLRI